jgi:transcriptional regulator with XRE-family HTH domain
MSPAQDLVKATPTISGALPNEVTDDLLAHSHRSMGISSKILLPSPSMATTKNKTSLQGNNGRIRAAVLRKAPLPPGDDLGAAEMARRVADCLREKRKARGLSLDQLATTSGVSRAALSQIETQKTNPSLGVLWKVAVGLGIPFSELLGSDSQTISVLRRGEAQVLRSGDGRMESRPLSPAGSCPWVELYELRLVSHAVHNSDPHAAGTREVVVVLNGQLRVSVGTDCYDLVAGDSISFLADRPHCYENVSSSEARCHDVIIYAR